MQSLRYPGWLLRCFYAVAKVPGVVARVLPRYPGWFLRCCYTIAKVPGVVAKLLLCSCNGTQVVARVVLYG